MRHFFADMMTEAEVEKTSRKMAARTVVALT